MSLRGTLLMQQKSKRQMGGSGRHRASSASPEPLVQLADDDDLPPHEPLQLPLNSNSIQSVSEVGKRSTTLRVYDKHLKRSAEMLREAIGAVNDSYTERKSQLQSMTERRQERGRDQPSAAEEEVARLVARLAEHADGLTEQIEQRARKTIDLQMELEDERKALEWTSTQLVALQGEERHRQAQRELEAANRLAAQAQVAAQKRKRTDGADGGSGGEGEEEDEKEGEDLLPDEDEGLQAASAIELLREERASRARNYAQMSAHQKYALNNDYITFKQTWHYALFPDGEVPLPDASAWFDASGEPAKYGPNADGGMGANGGAVDGVGNGDDDLIVEREIISFKCPLALTTMTDPYRSRMCKHVFEKSAIMEYLGNGPLKCPQTGCDKSLRQSDLVPDNVMRRRIERAEMGEQRRNEAAATSDIEDDDADDNVDVGSSPIDPVTRSKREATRAESVARTVKRERFQRTQQE